MTALVVQAMQWLHEQVEQTITGAATSLRPPPAVPEVDETPDVIDAEWRE